ncbi:MAG: hypothetical protein AAF327_15640 [Cyanobacteria bacterium P01_A01_bin.37]
MQGFLELIAALSGKLKFSSRQREQQGRQAAENAIARASAKLIEERGEEIGGLRIFDAEDYAIAKDGDTYTVKNLDDSQQAMEFSIAEVPDQYGKFRSQVTIHSNTISNENLATLLDGSKGVYNKPPKEGAAIDTVNHEVKNMGVLAPKGSKAISVAHELLESNDNKTLNMKHTYVRGKDGSISIFSNPGDSEKNSPSLIVGMGSKGKVHALGMNSENRTNFSAAHKKWSEAKNQVKAISVSESKPKETASIGER